MKKSYGKICRKVRRGIIERRVRAIEDEWRGRTGEGGGIAWSALLHPSEGCLTGGTKLSRVCRITVDKWVEGGRGVMDGWTNEWRYCGGGWLAISSRRPHHPHHCRHHHQYHSTTLQQTSLPCYPTSLTTTTSTTTIILLYYHHHHHSTAITTTIPTLP